MMRRYTKSTFKVSSANSRAFEIPHSGKIPEEMYVFTLSIMASTFTPDMIPEYTKTMELQAAMLKVLTKRLGMYHTTMEEDEKLLKDTLPSRRKMAIIVRLGEKKILKKAQNRILSWDTDPPAKRQKR
jgi:hypothetical protein